MMEEPRETLFLSVEGTHSTVRVVLKSHIRSLLAKSCHVLSSLSIITIQKQGQPRIGLPVGQMKKLRPRRKSGRAKATQGGRTRAQVYLPREGGEEGGRKE